MHGDVIKTKRNITDIKRPPLRRYFCRANVVFPYMYFCTQATSIRVNPLYLMLPVTVACSFAFMLPVATPPNAIVFASGQMEILDMVSFFRRISTAKPAGRMWAPGF